MQFQAFWLQYKSLTLEIAKDPSKNLFPTLLFDGFFPPNVDKLTVATGNCWECCHVVIGQEQNEILSIL